MIVLPAAAIVLVAMTVLEPSAEWALGAFGAAFFLFLAALAYPKGMGMGDVKLALLLGAMLGRTVPVALMLGMLAALVPSIVLFARHGSGRAEDGDPVCAVPLARRHRRALLRRRAARRVPEPLLAAPQLVRGIRQGFARCAPEGLRPPVQAVK